MIDENKTFEKFGYYSTDWAKKSQKKIVAICNQCGKERVIVKSGYRDLCTSCCQIGKHHSDETKAKISAAESGKNHYNFGKHHSKETKEKMRIAKLGTHHSEETKAKISAAEKGRCVSEKTKVKMRAAAPSGKNSVHWNPNLTDEEREIKRKTFEYRVWARIIKEIDNFTCVKCNARGGKLVSHHLLPYWEYPEARLDIDNGVTLCESCHKYFHHLYGSKYFTMDDFFIFCRDD